MKVKLNSNKKLVAEIRQKLKENNGYCPCSVVQTEDTKCKCKAFRDQIARGEPGECHCGLWVTTEDDATTNDTPVINASPETVKAVSDDDIVGRILKIKPEAKTFCGGNAIPDWVRKAELYVSRKNQNGTIMIGLSETCMDYDLLLASDVIITEKKREFVDSDEMLSNIDVRIMGVPSRIDNIRITQQRLRIPDENIFLDVNHEGCRKTAERAWSKPTDKEFVMVIQDDVELCDNFASCCNKIVKAHPDKIIALFQFRLTSGRYIPPLPSPYVSLGHGYASGQAIIMRSEWVADCLSGWETSGIDGDDTNINAWAEKSGKEIITTIPGIIQHIGIKSVYAPGRVLGKSDLYRKSAASADWDNDYVTSVTNIIR